MIKRIFTLLVLVFPFAGSAAPQTNSLTITAGRLSGIGAAQIYNAAAACGVAATVQKTGIIEVTFYVTYSGECANNLAFWNWAQRVSRRR